MESPPAPAPAEKKSCRILLNFTPTEEARLIAWSRAQEREPEQQIRYMLRDVLSGAEVVA